MLLVRTMMIPSWKGGGEEAEAGEVVDVTAVEGRKDLMSTMMMNRLYVQLVARHSPRWRDR